MVVNPLALLIIYLLGIPVSFVALSLIQSPDKEDGAFVIVLETLIWPFMLLYGIAMLIVFASIPLTVLLRLSQLARRIHGLRKHD